MQRLIGIKMRKGLLYIAIAAVLGGCTGQDVHEIAPEQSGRMPVLFSVGNTQTIVTRASASYMPRDGRFVCSMFFHAGATDTNDSPFYTGAPSSDITMTTTWLKINNATGNAVYWNRLYDNSVSTDMFGFDETAKCLYWQNRKNHVFLALADYNKLDTDDGSDSGTLRIYPDVTEKNRNKYMLAYDLTRGDKISMTQQPDPIQALETAHPTGYTPEANRVRLFFKHQFSQIQVNLKNAKDASVEIDENLIEKVELLGVSETGYVAYCIEPDGTVPATVAETVNVDDPKYAATKRDNPFGSSFDMFPRSTPATGYLKSFEAIAFGTLQAIRITWKESDAQDAVKHVATFKGLDATHKSLTSGRKYIYNIELRRSLIAQVTVQIAPWETDDTDYQADGTIQD